MLCEKCKKAKANTYYRTTVNGKVTEMYLCSDCMAKLQSTADSFFNLGSLFFEDPFFGKPIAVAGPKSCNTCGATARYIAETGKVGCADCYDTFSKELEAAILRTQGTLQHKAESKKDPIEEKKALLKEAIEKEEFEKAALLRDEIKKMETEQ